MKKLKLLCLLPALLTLTGCNEEKKTPRDWSLVMVENYLGTKSFFYKIEEIPTETTSSTTNYYTYSIHVAEDAMFDYSIHYRASIGVENKNKTHYAISEIVISSLWEHIEDTDEWVELWVERQYD